MDEPTELPLINETRPVDETDDPVIEEIRAVLIKHGALDRFGIALLHRHFDLEEGEVLLETADPNKRTTTTSVVSKESLQDQETIETQWRLGKEPGSKMVCVECKVPHFA